MRPLGCVRSRRHPLPRRAGGRLPWSEPLKEHLLPYDVVRRSADAAREILTFAQSCYDAGARLGGWDATALAYRG
ncbi:MAG: DUF5996 family protein [Polyangiaceae bacterium]